jgi:hypothetical protein
MIMKNVLAAPYRRFSPPTVKEWLAAVCMLFDWLVVRQVLAVNPAAVCGPKRVVRTGKSPVLFTLEARQLPDSIESTTVVIPPRGRETQRESLSVLLGTPLKQDR